jgi:hypothetical protein
MINRRNFTIALLLLPIMAFTGCVPAATQIAADGAVVAQAMLNVAAIEAVTNPQLAQNLTTAANALKAATANWTTGSSLAIVNDAAQVAEVALSAIPETAAIAPLIPIAMAALDIIITEAGGPSPAPSVSANVVAPSINPYRGKYKISHMPLRSPKGDFESAWNGEAKKHSALASAILK